MIFVLGFVVGFCACAGSLFVAARLYGGLVHDPAHPGASKAFLFGKEKGAVLEEKEDPAKTFFNL